MLACARISPPSPTRGEGLRASCSAPQLIAMTRYVEFAVTSNFSFLWGASHPEELIAEAARLAYFGMGLCDRNSVAGVVRAHLAKREMDLKLRYHPGARLVFCDGTPDVLAYPGNRAGWAKLCRLLTRGNLRARKGDCLLSLPDLLDHADGLELIVMQRTTRSTQEGERNADYQLAPVTSPLVGASLPSGPDPRVAIAKRWREGGIRSADSNKHPTPHP